MPHYVEHRPDCQEDGILSAYSMANQDPTHYYHQKRQEMLAFVPEEAKIILDVGCGAGVFAAQLRERGARELWGIEMNPNAAAEAQKKLDHVLVGDVAARMTALPDNRFDCILFNDVLEHLVDPYTLLAQVKPKLKNGGVVVASIPNVRYALNLWHVLVTKDWEYEESGIRDKTHLRFFTQKSIRRMFEEAGYTVTTCEGINGITSWKFSLLNALTFEFFADTNFLQFAVVAKPR